VADAWFDAGVRLIQLRAKTLTLGPALELAEALVARARRAGALCLINDRADVARLADADGVHVGQEDLSPAEVRRQVGPGAIVGLSTHLEAQVRAAQGQPVSYVAIGPVFTTVTKAHPDPVVGLAGVSAAVEAAAALDPMLPVVAIGGLTCASAPALLRAGAASLAVAADLLAADPAARARAWLAEVGA
jgi:thiamine-phosphate pyrophosphorylase